METFGQYTGLVIAAGLLLVITLWFFAIKYARNWLDEYRYKKTRIERALESQKRDDERQEGQQRYRQLLNSFQDNTRSNGGANTELLAFDSDVNSLRDIFVYIGGVRCSYSKFANHVVGTITKEVIATFQNFIIANHDDVVAGSYRLHIYRANGFMHIELRIGGEAVIVSDRTAYYCFIGNFDDALENQGTLGNMLLDEFYSTINKTNVPKVLDIRFQPGLKVKWFVSSAIDYDMTPSAAEPTAEPSVDKTTKDPQESLAERLSEVTYKEAHDIIEKEYNAAMHRCCYTWIKHQEFLGEVHPAIYKKLCGDMEVKSNETKPKET